MEQGSRLNNHEGGALQRHENGQNLLVIVHDYYAITPFHPQKVHIGLQAHAYNRSFPMEVSFSKQIRAS